MKRAKKFISFLFLFSIPYVHAIQFTINNGEVTQTAKFTVENHIKKAKEEFGFKIRTIQRANSNSISNELQFLEMSFGDQKIKLESGPLLVLKLTEDKETKVQTEISIETNIRDEYNISHDAEQEIIDTLLSEFNNYSLQALEVDHKKDYQIGDSIEAPTDQKIANEIPGCGKMNIPLTVPLTIEKISGELVELAGSYKFDAGMCSIHLNLRAVVSAQNSLLQSAKIQAEIRFLKDTLVTSELIITTD